MALQLLFCYDYCHPTGYERADADPILEEVLVNEQEEELVNEQHEQHEQHEQQDITRQFQGDFSAFGNPVLLGTQGMTGRRPLQVPKISGFEKVTTSEQDQTSNGKGVPSQELPVNEVALSLLVQLGIPTHGTFSTSSRLESLSPGGSCRSCRMTDGWDLPISSYRLDMDELERHLSRHVASAPSRNHSVHVSEVSVTPYGESQRSTSFQFSTSLSRQHGRL